MLKLSCHLIFTLCKFQKSYHLVFSSFSRVKPFSKKILLKLKRHLCGKMPQSISCLTDRFNNADTTNDQNYGRKADGATLRSFMGGDIKGVTQKIKDGYFTELGVSAIWMTPVVEQIHGFVDEGTGKSYGFHGYWTKDWTALDRNFGSMSDYAKMVEVAHSRGIRIIMDVVLNHTGPATSIDPQWPLSWVRTDPNCTYKDYESTVSCTLVDNLPDILTGSNEEVELPQPLVNKWKFEGRYDQEMAELDAFFERTGYPRAPKYYLIKWLADLRTRVWYRRLPAGYSEARGSWRLG